MEEQTPNKIIINQSSSASALDDKPQEIEISPDVKIESMKSLRRSLNSEEIAHAFEEAQNVSEDKIHRELLKTHLPVVDRDRRNVDIPANLANQERNLYYIICSICHLTGVSISTYETDTPSVTKKDSDAFLDGLLIGTFDSKPTKLDRNKTLGELGRCIAFSLKVRGELHKLFKAEWLVKNHWFFGNNPTEVMNKVPVPFGSKVKLIDIWENKNFGDAMYSVLLYLFEELGLSQLNEQDYTSSILKYSLRFEDIVAKFYQPIRSTKRGKTIISGYRKGKKPNPSPLLTKGEYQLILKLADPMWKDLDTYKSEWLNILLAQTRASVTIDELRKLYKSRFEFLQKFGALTTKRLQEIRLIENNANLKKIDITNDMLSKLLKNRRNPGVKFARELEKLFKTNQWAIDEFEINNDLQEKQFRQYAVNEIVVSYVEDGLFIIKDDSAPEPEILKLEKDVMIALKQVKTFLRRARELSNRLNQFRGVLEKELFERKLVAFLVISSPTLEAIKSLEKINTVHVTFIMSRLYHSDISGENIYTFFQGLGTEIEQIERLAKTSWKEKNEFFTEIRNSINHAWNLCEKNSSILKNLK